MTASASTTARNDRVSTPHGQHSRGSCSGYIDFWVVAHEDSLARMDPESLHRTVKDLSDLAC